MYCIIVTGIPASGKSTTAKYLSDELQLPMVSKDEIKEIMFDTIGFKSRAEKVNLGAASTEIMYYFAEQQMKTGKPFILENNFEDSSKEGLESILRKYCYKAVTVCMCGDFHVIYQRFIERNSSPDRHLGHIVNDYYPRADGDAICTQTITEKNFIDGIKYRGMDKFTIDGPRIEVDSTDFAKINLDEIVNKIRYATDL